MTLALAVAASASPPPCPADVGLGYFNGVWITCGMFIYDMNEVYPKKFKSAHDVCTMGFFTRDVECLVTPKTCWPLKIADLGATILGYPWNYTAPEGVAVTGWTPPISSLCTDSCGPYRGADSCTSVNGYSAAAAKAEIAAAFPSPPSPPSPPSVLCDYDCLLGLIGGLVSVVVVLACVPAVCRLWKRLSPGLPLAVRRADAASGTALPYVRQNE